MDDKSEWLTKLNYIEFPREVGRHFSVNRMLSMESVKLRLERDQELSFIEFNYMVLQAYDFVELNRRHGCILQMGGSDQWGNIVNGIDLGRRMGTPQLYALTSPLITTSSGAKMGKTAAGAVWLNPDLVSAYEYWQFWRNTEDADVGRFLALYTFLPMEQVRELSALEGAELRRAKQVLAFEATTLTHGQDAAREAESASRAAFAGAGDDLSAIPAVDVPAADLAAGVPLVDLLVASRLASSKSDARRLIAQGGAYVDGEQVTTLDYRVTAAGDGPLLLRAGKKHLRRIQPV